MRKWLVDSGRMRHVVDAESPTDACCKAVRMELENDEPATLGVIMECVELVDGESYYSDTESVCKLAGAWDANGYGPKGDR